MKEESKSRKEEYDRYGFRVDTEKQSDVQEHETERERKWLEIVKDFHTYKITNHTKFHRRIRKGIPDSLRSSVWPLLLNVTPPCENFDSYFKMGVLDCERTILADVPRTLANVCMFSQKAHKELMKKVLICYANYDSQRKNAVGYTQGMSFICAFLLMYLDEKTAFWSFRNLMDYDPWRMSEFFKPGFPRLMELAKVWEHILNDKFPKVKRKMVEVEITSMMYIPNWFLCLYLNIQFPPRLRLNIFDRFLAFGTRAVVSFGLAIMNFASQDIAKTGFDNIINLLQTPETIEPLKDTSRAIEEYDKWWLGKNYYESVFRKLQINAVY